MLLSTTQSHISLLPGLRHALAFTFLIFYFMVALPAFFNFGSSELGCPLYEMRTGNACFDILK